MRSFLDIFTTIESNSRTLTDQQMECMHFGICTFVPKPSEEIPYFYYYSGKNVKIKRSFTAIPKYFNDLQKYFNNGDEKLISYTYNPNYLRKKTGKVQKL